MSDILGRILASKRAEVERARRARPIEQLMGSPSYAAPRRDFRAAVSSPGRTPHVIAEIKRRSPSAGLIREDFDPAALARSYLAGGASALSVLTDEAYFGGCPEHIAAVRSAVSLPVLRKDFIIDEYQVYESRAIGADAVLLIGEALRPDEVAPLSALAVELELTVLVEVHTRATMDVVLAALPAAARPRTLLGINNRDLTTQRIDLSTVQRLAAAAPRDLPLVAESGIRTRTDVERMHAAGARAILIGESLLRCEDPAAALRELLA